MIEIYKNRFEINLKHLKNFYNLDIDQLDENDTEKILGKLVFSVCDSEQIDQAILKHFKIYKNTEINKLKFCQI